MPRGLMTAPPQHSPSLPGLYLIDTCSLVNPGLPPGIAPHGLVTNLIHKHTLSLNHTVISAELYALIPTLTVTTMSSFYIKHVRKNDDPPKRFV